MKTKFAKILSLLLALAMFVSFAGCDLLGGINKDDDKTASASEKHELSDKEKIIGTWKADAYIGDMIKESLSGEDAEIAQYFDFDDLKMVIVWKFDEDGNLELAIDEDSVSDLYDDMIDVILDGMEEYMKGVLEDNGYTGTLDDYLQEAGMTMDDLKNGVLEEMDMSEEDFIEMVGAEDISESHEYKIKGGVIDFNDGESTVEYKFDGDDTVKLDNAEGFDGDFENFFPMTLVKD